MRVKGTKVWAPTSAEFAAIVARNTSRRGVILDLGYESINAASSRDLRNRIEKERVSTQHFRVSRNPDAVGRRIPLDKILVEKSTYACRQELKKRLVAERALKDECSICGLPPLWQGKALTLQLDHMNGVPDDNRMENLRIVCPNCHTQTTTFCGKNKKTLQLVEKTCLFCGVTFTRRETDKSLYCSRPCAHADRRKAKRPSADKLRRLVSKYPVKRIAKHYGVSDKAVAQWCRLVDITPPGRGYWAKVRAGIDPNAEPAKCRLCGKPATTGEKKYCSRACADQAMCKTPMPTPERLAKLLKVGTVAQVAKRLKVSQPTIVRWCKWLNVEHR